jgi:ankyrin repeat protein
MNRCAARSFAGALATVAAMSVALMSVAALTAAPDESRVADAAMRGDRELVRALIKQAADVNAAQGDGMTALHWAASQDDVAMAQLLLQAGANIRAKTRLGGFTALWMASQNGNARMIELLLTAGADANVATTLGMTPLMMAAGAGRVDAIKALVVHGADVNAREQTYGQTPLMFAAALNRPEAIGVLIELGADTGAATKVRLPPPRGRGAQGAAAGPSPDGQATPAAPGRGQPAGDRPREGSAGAPAGPASASTDQQPAGNPEVSREAQEPMGGLTPLLYAARQGHHESVRALLDHGAAINEVSADRTSPLMMAVINGRFDLAMYLLERGADPRTATLAGGTPLYRVVDLQWAPKSFYPQPSTKQEKVTYLELMKALIARGADPNARLTRQLWYTGYGFELDGLDPAGATPFWRAAQVADLDAMRLLVAAGADPNIATIEGVTPLLAAAGDGFHGNDAITVPAGRMPAVRYLIEECGADVNAIDQKAGDSTSILHTNTRAYTPLHSAAARGDNEMILYLVSKGARVDLVGKNGLTVADMANGPRERIQPFPETVKLLVSLGAKNSNRCVSC